MKNYKVSTDILANFLTPTVMGGRKNVLWIQSLLYPLHRLNSVMQPFFEEKKVESCVTSQVGWFEWYLTQKMKKYFINKDDSIRIIHYTDNGVPFFFSDDQGLVPYVVYTQGETPTSLNQEELPKPLEFKNEKSNTINTSFRVQVPKLTVSENVFSAEINYHINKYKLGGKTYNIQYT